MDSEWSAGCSLGQPHVKCFVLVIEQRPLQKDETIEFGINVWPIRASIRNEEQLNRIVVAQSNYYETWFG